MHRAHRTELEKEITQLKKRIAALEKDKRTRKEFYSEHAEIIETMMRLREIERLTNQLDPRAFADFPECEPWRKQIALLGSTTRVLLRQARRQWSTFWD